MDREKEEFNSTVRNSLIKLANLNLFAGITSPLLLVSILIYLKYFKDIQNFNIILIVILIAIPIILGTSLFTFFYYKKISKYNDEDLEKSSYYKNYQKRVNRNFQI